MTKELEALYKLVEMAKGKTYIDENNESKNTEFIKETSGSIKSALKRLERLEIENAKLKKLTNIFIDWLYKNNCGEQADLLKEMLEEK